MFIDIWPRRDDVWIFYFVLLVGIYDSKKQSTHVGTENQVCIHVCDSRF